MPESVRRTKKSVPYFHMTRETVADRQNRPVNGLFCLYDLFFGEILVFGQKICQIKILQIAVSPKSLKTPDSSYFSV